MRKRNIPSFRRRLFESASGYASGGVIEGKGDTDPQKAAVEGAARVDTSAASSAAQAGLDYYNDNYGTAETAFIDPLTQNVQNKFNEGASYVGGKIGEGAEAAYDYVNDNVDQGDVEYVGNKIRRVVDAVGFFSDPVTNDFKASSQAYVDPSKFRESAQSRGAQLSLSQRMEAEADRRDPSRAQGLMNQALQQNKAAAMSMAASNKTMNSALAKRLAAQQLSSANMQAAGQAAQLGMQEQVANRQQQLAERQAAMQGYNTARGQDVAEAQIQASGMTSAGDQALKAQDINYQVSKDNTEAARNDAAGILGGAGGVIGEIFYEGGEAELEDARGSEIGSVDPSTEYTDALSQDSSANKDLISAFERAAGPMAVSASTTVPESDSGISKAPSVKASKIQSSIPKESNYGTGVSQVARAIQNLSSGVRSSGSGKDTSGIDAANKAAGLIGNIIKVVAAFKEGGEVPGEASVPGDSVKNDTVPAFLSPGEVVIPRSIMEGEHADERAAGFVAAIKAERSKEQRHEEEFYAATDALAEHAKEKFSRARSVVDELPPETVARLAHMYGKKPDPMATWYLTVDGLKQKEPR